MPYLKGIGPKIYPTVEAAIAAAVEAAAGGESVKWWVT